MAWIKHVPLEEAKDELASWYERLAGPGGRPDNVLTIHGLRPHTLAGHVGLYKAVLHHSGNTLPKALQETVAVWISLLNGCSYCVEHHFVGLQRAFADDEAAARSRYALERKDLASVFDAPTVAALRYAEKLTRAPGAMALVDVERLRVQGFEDAEILELNQLTSYFGYVNRLVLGLGVELEGDTLGQSPNDSDDLGDVRHE